MQAKLNSFLAILAVIVMIFGMGIQDSQSFSTAQAREPDLPMRQGAWLDSMTFTEQGDAGAAIALLQANELDLYAAPVVDSGLFQTVLEDEYLSYSESYVASRELTFNPSGPIFSDGRLNPFSIAKIREAMNWLIDRDYITQSIAQGLATPKFTVLPPNSTDYQRFQTTLEEISNTYAYNLDMAKTAIDSEMLAMGASLQNGTWYYNDEPVTIIFIIRIEDERLPIGDYVADQLEKIGFTIDRKYMARAQATPIWNLSDPAEGQWHIYTGGWINTAVKRDNGTDFCYFYTPLGSSSPLWQAYNPTPEFLDLCQRLRNFDYSNMAERASLFEQALNLSMNDSGTGTQGAGSLRVWLDDNISFTPRRVGTTVASDLAGSVMDAAMFPYVARFDGIEGGNMRIAQPGLLVAPWNPVAGSNWIYDAFPIKATQDYATLMDPNTGLSWPQRIESAEVVALDGLPITKTLEWVDLTYTPTIEVPAEAWVNWDAVNQRFISAGETYTQPITAASKVTIYYPENLFNTFTWHDGSPLSPGDFILRMILQFDRAKPESLLYDESYLPFFDSFMSHFKGVKIESINPLVITTYDNQAYYILDAELLASNFTWWPSYNYGPGAWHNLTPAIRAEEAGILAFSSDKAGKLGIEWTNMVSGVSLPILKVYMDLSANEQYIPYVPTMSDYVALDEVTARWAALQAWYDARGHFWLGTGPFYLDQISLDPKTVTLAYYAAFPDAAGRWDSFAAANPPQITISHAGGAPGSFFNVIGSGFIPNDFAFIVVDNHVLTSLPIDASGSISFTLSTEGALPGEYHLRVSENPSAGLLFTLDDAFPLQPKEGDLPVVELPHILSVYMPFAQR